MCNQKRTSMKKFSLTGNTAVWDALNVEATNNYTGRVEKLSAVAEGKEMVVSLLEGFDPRNPSTDNIPEEQSGYAFRHGRRRAFLLRHKGVCVGWAQPHRVEREYEVAVALTTTETFNIKAKSQEEAELKAAEQLEAAIAEFNELKPFNIEVEDYRIDARLA